MVDRTEVKVCLGISMLQPEDDLAHFIEHPDFTIPWKSKGFTDDHLCMVQTMAMLDAANTQPIPNTGGLRCRSFSADDQAIKFWYMYFPEMSTVYFILAQTEELNEELTEEDKKLLRERAAEIALELETPRKL